MPIKLTPINLNSPKDLYIVELECMHGDADKFEKVEVKCKNEKGFESMMLAYKDKPLSGSSGGNEKAYCKWCDDSFGELTVPEDIVYNDIRCNVQSIKGFYYDKNGVKWIAEVVELVLDIV